jgi:hypothetical protein
VRAYRERMADYSSMRSLDVWYDTITVERVLAEVEQRGGQEAHHQAAPEGPPAKHCRIHLSEARRTPRGVAPDQGRSRR